jgi:TPR repeat protein
MMLTTLSRIPAALAVGLSVATGIAHGQETRSSSAGISDLREQAIRYEHGEGVTKDPVKAVELFCAAAREGDPESQYQLGWMYANGRGILRDDSLAAGLFELSATQGHNQAAAVLATLADVPREVPQCMREWPMVEWDDSPPINPPPDEPFVASSPEQGRIAELVKTIAPEYQVSPSLALAIIRAESNFNPLARSPKNAQGLMQLMPETSARFNVSKPFDMVQNLRGGLAYLRWLLAYFEGSVPLVAAAYNAGERAVERYHGIPPYLETRTYVRRVMEQFRRDRHPYDASITTPSPGMDQIRNVSGH